MPRAFAHDLLVLVKLVCTEYLLRCLLKLFVHLSLF